MNINAKMIKRIVFGLIMIAFMVGIFWLDWHFAQGLIGLPMACLFLVLICLAIWEVRKMALSAGLAILPISAVITCGTLTTLPLWWQFINPLAQPDGGQMLAIMGGCVMLIFAEQMARASTAGAFGRIACTILTLAYLGVAGAIVLNIRVQFGLPMLILFLAAVKFTDIGAYFTGSFLGRHKLIAWLSPGKTWEGLAGGLLASAVVTAILAWVMGVELAGIKMTWLRAAGFGAAVGLAGQFGDLGESLLKRSVNIKDSGVFLPEFGGILDILDSPLLSAPMAYGLLILMTR
jgi:phosphatidate cytidylyltransferase